MSILHLTHSEVMHGTRERPTLRLWNKRVSAAIADQGSWSALRTVARVGGYLLAISSIAFVGLTGQFPWFLLMLVALVPLLALMMDQG